MSIMPSQHFPPTPATAPPPLESFSSPSNPAVIRYLDAYRVARLQEGLGRSIKIGALIVGGLIILTSLIYAANSPTTQNASFFAPDKTADHLIEVLMAAVGLVLGGLGSSLGALISAGGQITKATLDAAVNTSPFLDNDERARVLSL